MIKIKKKIVTCSLHNEFTYFNWYTKPQWMSKEAEIMLKFYYFFSLAWSLVLEYCIDIVFIINSVFQNHFIWRSAAFILSTVIHIFLIFQVTWLDRPSSRKRKIILALGYNRDWLDKVFQIVQRAVGLKLRADSRLSDWMGAEGASCDQRGQPVRDCCNSNSLLWIKLSLESKVLTLRVWNKRFARLFQKQFPVLKGFGLFFY